MPPNPILIPRKSSGVVSPVENSFLWGCHNSRLAEETAKSRSWKFEGKGVRESVQAEIWSEAGADPAAPRAEGHPGQPKCGGGGWTAQNYAQGEKEKAPGMEGANLSKPMDGKVFSLLTKSQKSLAKLGLSKREELKIG